MEAERELLLPLGLLLSFLGLLGLRLLVAFPGGDLFLAGDGDEYELDLPRLLGGDRTLLGAERDLDRKGRRGGDLERRRTGDLRGGERARRTTRGDLRRRGPGDLCRPMGLTLALRGDLNGERRLLRKGEGDRLRDGLVGGCRCGGDSKARRRGEPPRRRSGDKDLLLGGGESDLRRGDSRRRGNPSLSPSPCTFDLPPTSFLEGTATGLGGEDAFLVGRRVNLTVTTLPSIWPPSICCKALSASTRALKKT